MIIIEKSVEVLFPDEHKNVLEKLELIGRVCYKSEHKICTGSAKDFVKMLISKKHYGILEHHSISVRFICSRGASHELVRHRLASFAQESTRYCAYKELTFVAPIQPEFVPLLAEIERAYRVSNLTAEQARQLLPNYLKTEVVMTANIREWRHFFDLRTNKKAHPEIRELATTARQKLSELIPVVFEYEEDMSNEFRTFSFFCDGSMARES